LPATLVWTYPTVESLAGYLTQLLCDAESSNPAAEAESDVALDEPVTDLDEDAVEAVLRTMERDHS
jgi:hypothetical protein